MAERLQSQDGLLSSGPTVDLSIASSFRVCLFGSFEAQVEDIPLPRLRSRRGQWLLALLALRAGRPVERSWLAGTLWPDSTEENALISLRQTLTDLRHALGAERHRLLSPTSRTLCLDVEGAFLDVFAFDAALKRGDPASLTEAVRLHHRPLLEDCYEEWVLPEREHREQGLLNALQSLASHALTAGRPDEAIGHLRRLVTVDPFREDARRGLMTALTQTGSPGEAVWVYRDLRLLLQRELRAEPAPETRALYEQIRRDTRRLPEPPAKSSREARDVSAPPATAPLGAGSVLPKPLTELIGRERDVEEVGVRLFRSRLVTLMGIGGVGKTRLAIRVAEVWAEDQPEGVAFVSLAPVADATQTARVVAGALGIAEEPGRPLVETLGETLRERRLLLVLDNCEHLLEACAHLATRLLSECPALVILTTSRQPLGVMGETVWAVGPLALPSSLEKAAAEAIGRSPAVRLFVDRASSVRPGFSCTEANASAIAEICVRLDGVPLALELAAARVKMLTPEQILGRLDDRFRLLSQGSRTALPRQQTLRALIDWSYDLLSETERRLLGCCSAFAGGWTLEMAEAVCAETKEEAAGVLDDLTGLVDQSLVQVTSDEGLERRYRFLVTVRQYARERLEADAESEKISRRHRDWALALADQAQPHFRGPERVFWLDRLETEHDNLRAALEFCRNDAAGGLAYLTLAADLWRFWMERGYFAEGREHLASALGRTGGEAAPGVRIKALNGAAAMAWHQGDLQAARVWMEEGLGLARETGSLSYLENCLHNLGNVIYSQGDLQTARPLWEEGLAIRRQIGNTDGIRSSLNNLGCLAYDEGDLARAGALHEEALTLAADWENRHERRAALVGLGNIRELQGDHEAARAYYEDALALSRELDDKDCISGCLTGLGNVALRSGETALAASLLRDALVIARDTGMKPVLLGALQSLAELRLTLGDLPQAVRVWAVVETQREALGLPMLPPDRVRHDEGIAFARAALGQEAFLSAWNEGALLPLDQAVALALEEAPATPVAPAANPIFHFSATDAA